MVLETTPLEADAYGPYGSLIMAARGDVEARSANQGRAKRYNRLADFANLRLADASMNISVFRVDPYLKVSLDIRLLEKHPKSTQLFVPMNAERYLVIVALGDERPDLSTLKAFVARPHQAISYHPGVWHHPMVALDSSTDFVCMSYEDDTPADCVEYPFLESEIGQVQFA